MQPMNECIRKGGNSPIGGILLRDRISMYINYYAAGAVHLIDNLLWSSKKLVPWPIKKADLIIN
jgi:hypothetical protein